MGLAIRLRAELFTGVVIVVVWVWLSDRLPVWGAALVVAVASR